MKQRFSFPHTVGRASEVTYVNVTPQYEIKNTDEKQVLSGIYHVQVELKLEPGEGEKEGIFIEEMDLDGAIGYFEYALPLEVTLDGKEQVKNYQLDEIEGLVLGNGVLEIQAKELIERAQLEKEVQHKEVQPVEKEIILQKVPENKNTELVSEIQHPPETNEETISVAHIVEDVKSKPAQASIVNWLKLSKGFHTEMITLNPVLKKQISDET